VRINKYDGNNKNPLTLRTSLGNSNFNFKKLLKPLVQLLITGLALYLVLKNTDTAKLVHIISSADPWYLLLALFFFNLSKIFNALRLNRFFKAIGLDLSTMYNVKLYYLGMFYNIFLPGGVGGDGYKIYVLQKNHGMKMINVFHAVLWDRICGIVALVFLSVAVLLPSSFALKFSQFIPFNLSAWVLLVALYPLTWILNKIFYKQFIDIFTVTAIESLVIQLTQTLSAFFVLQAIALPANHIDYLAIFLLSTVATVLPITIGGAGAREITFYYLLNVIHLDTNPGVALSLIFFGISAISSLVGVLTKIRHEKKIPES